MKYHFTRALAHPFSMALGATASSALAYVCTREESGVSLGEIAFASGSIAANLAGNVLSGRLGNVLHDALNEKVRTPTFLQRSDDVEQLCIIAAQASLSTFADTCSMLQAEATSVRKCANNLAAIWKEMKTLPGFRDDVQRIMESAKPLLRHSLEERNTLQAFWRLICDITSRKFNLGFTDILLDNISTFITDNFGDMVVCVLREDISRKDSILFSGFVIRTLSELEVTLGKLQQDHTHATGSQDAALIQMMKMRVGCKRIARALVETHHDLVKLVEATGDSLASDIARLDSSLKQLEAEQAKFASLSKETLSEMNERFTDVSTAIGQLAAIKEATPTHFTLSADSDVIPHRLRALLASDPHSHRFVNNVISLTCSSQSENTTSTITREIGSRLQLTEALIKHDLHHPSIGSAWTQITPADVVVICMHTVLEVAGEYLPVTDLVELISGKDSLEIKELFDLKHSWELFLRELYRHDPKITSRDLGFTIPPFAVMSRALSRNDASSDQRVTATLREFLRRESEIVGVLQLRGILQFPCGTKHSFESRIPNYLCEALTLLVSKGHGGARKWHAWLESRVVSVREFRQVHLVFLYLLFSLRRRLYQIMCGDQHTHVRVRRPKQDNRPVPESFHAVVDVRYADVDPEAVTIEITNDNPHSRFAIADWVQATQELIDTSWAIIGETYGESQRHCRLGFSIRRFRIHLSALTPANSVTSPRHLDVRAKFDIASPGTILKMLVGPLYGNRPEIGIRELIQNSVDSVLARQARLDNESKTSTDEGIITIRFGRRSAGDTWAFPDIPSHWMHWIAIEDNGLGMSSRIIVDYFLKAGASYRTDLEWVKEFGGPDGTPSLRRIGRFGIGVFAAFLLGYEMRVLTREAQSPTGIAFTAALGDESLILEECTCNDGTTISIRLAESTYDYLTHQLPINFDPAALSWNWYRCPSPAIQMVVGIDAPRQLLVPGEFPDNISDHLIINFGLNSLPGSEWSYTCLPKLTINGMIIGSKATEPMMLGRWHDAGMQLSFKMPNVSVVDVDNKIPLTLARDKFATDGFPFEPELARSVVEAYIAALIYFLPTTNELPKGIGSDSYWWITRQFERVSYPLNMSQVLPEGLLVGLKQRDECCRWACDGAYWIPIQLCGASVTVWSPKKKSNFSECWKLAREFSPLLVLPNSSKRYLNPDTSTNAVGRNVSLVECLLSHEAVRANKYEDKAARLENSMYYYSNEGRRSREEMDAFARDHVFSGLDWRSLSKANQLYKNATNANLIGKWHFDNSSMENDVFTMVWRSLGSPRGIALLSDQRRVECSAAFAALHEYFSLYKERYPSQQK